MEATTSEATPVAMTPADEEEEELMRPISEPQPPSNPAPSNEMFEIEVGVILGQRPLFRPSKQVYRRDTAVRGLHCFHGISINLISR